MLHKLNTRAKACKYVRKIIIEPGKEVIKQRKLNSMKLKSIKELKLRGKDREPEKL